MADLIPTATKLKDGKASINTKIASIDTTTASLQTQITDNETDIENKLATHKTSTDHSADKITYSGTILNQTNVKGAVEAVNTRVDNIVGQTGSSNTEIVDARLSVSGTANATLKNRLDTMENKQLAAVNSPVTIKRGLNSVNAPEGGKLDVKVKGKTLVNLLGKDGNFETLPNYTTYQATVALNSDNVKYGSNSVKLTSTAASGDSAYYRSFDFKAGKYYVLLGDAKNVDSPGAVVYINDGTTRKGNAVLAITFAPSYLKYAAGSDITVSVGVLFTQTATGQSAYFDGLRLYEIDSATYNKIDVDAEYTGDKLAEKFPYVDSMRSLTTPYIEKKGKNLLPPFTSWTMHANSVVTEPYKFTLNATANYQNNHIKIDVLPSTTYTFSGNLGGGVVWIHNYSKGVVGTQLSSGTTPFTFTTSSNTDQVNILLDNNVTTGAFTFSNPQLELGSVASTFTEFNSDYAYAISDSTGRPLALCSNIDGTVVDEINLSKGVKFKRFEYLDLDGSLGWTYHQDGTGEKTAKFTVGIGGVTATERISKYDGSIIKHSDVAIGGDTSGFDVNVLYVAIKDIDSGWTEAMVPDASDIKAYFYGYVMCSSDGSAYVSGTKYWKKITDGTGITSMLPTASYSGYTPYKLQYQLATAVEEVVSVEGLINLHSGLNQVESGEGVIVRERLTPTQPLANTSIYRINNKWSAAVVGANYLKNRADKIFAIYKNGTIDKKWTIFNSNTDAGNANGNAFADIKAVDYDTTASYEASYALLDRYGYTSNVVDVTASVPSTQKAVLESVVQQQADTATAVSVIQNNFARKNQGAWIAPVLLNAWVNSAYTSGYFKDEFGFVRFRGTIINGTSTNGTVLFTLPQSFRPKNNVSFPIRIYTTGEGLGTLLVEPSGSVKILSGSTELSLDSVSFRAEQ